MKNIMKYVGLVAFAILAACGVITIKPEWSMLGLFGVVTFDQTGGSTGTVMGGAFKDRVFQIMRRVTISLTGVTNDVVKAIPVKAGTKVLTTAMRLVTKSNGTALALKLGDGDATGGFQNTTLDAVGGAVGLTQGMLPADTNGVTPKIYSADDTIDILLSTVTAAGTTAAVVDVMALCEDTSTDPSTYTSPVVTGSA